MQHLTLLAPAKINLSLDIVGQNAAGYHLLETVMQSIDLADVIEVDLGSTKNHFTHILLSCDNRQIPSDQRNTAWKAADLFFSHEKIRPAVKRGFFVDIRITKRIPIAAGLGGGSADAAAVLLLLNQCFDSLLQPDDLVEIAVQTGADVPFCLRGGTAFCEGVGDRITPLPSWPGLPVLLCCPNQALLTRDVFASYEKAVQSGDLNVKRPDLSKILDAIRKHDLKALAAATSNVLYPIAQNMYPKLAQMMEQMRQSGAILTQMSGSGPTLFALFERLEDCYTAKKRMEAVFPQDRVYTCLTLADRSEKNAAGFLPCGISK